MQHRFMLNRILLLIFRFMFYSFLFFGALGIFQFFIKSGLKYDFSFFFTILIAILFQNPIDNFLRNIIDRNFYRKLYQLNLRIKKFNKDLNKIIEYENLIFEIKKFFKKSFFRQKFAIYFIYENSFELEFCHPPNLKIPKIIEFNEANFREEIFHKEAQFYPLSKVFPEIPGHSDYLATLMENFEVFVPLISFKNARGFILFDRSFENFLEFPETRLALMNIFQKISDLLETTSLYSALKKNSLENALMLEISQKITSSLNLQEVLDNIMDSLSKLVDFDAAGIFLIDKQKGLLKYMNTRGYNKRVLEKVRMKIDQGISGQAIREGRPIISPDVSREPHYFKVRKETRSQITVPIFSGEQPIGALVLESNRLNHFTRADAELLMAFSGLASIAINNAQLYEDSLAKKRLEGELLIASRIQKMLLPRRPVTIPGVEIDALNIPSLIVSGDLFDVVRLSEDRLAVAIGDVSGKGAGGALLMAVVYAGFKSLLREIYEVSEVVALLNNLLAETTTPGHYATFFFGIIDRQRNTFTYCNAGHNPPLHVKSDKKVNLLSTGGIVIGFLSNQPYRQEEIHLDPGDYLVLYTDGVTEIKNAAGQEFGEKRLIRLIKENCSKSPRELKSIIIKSIENFSGRYEFPDDVTLLLIKYK